MTRVVVLLEHALDLLLDDSASTVASALVAVDLHEIVVTIHEVDMVSIEGTDPVLTDTARAAVQRALVEMDTVPGDQRPLWLLALRSELASTLGGMS